MIASHYHGANRHLAERSAGIIGSSAWNFEAVGGISVRRASEQHYYQPRRMRKWILVGLLEGLP